MARKLLIFASGTKSDGGSGFRNLVIQSRGEKPELAADIVAVVSNYPDGGVRKHADQLGIPFRFFPGPFPKWDMSEAEKEPLQRAVDEEALRIAEEFKPDTIAFSGWMKLVRSLDPRHTINIHPGLLSVMGGKYGGNGMYGDHVHTAVHADLEAGLVSVSGPTMHFVTPEYDRGPAFFETRIELKPGMSWEDIKKAVNKAEHEWQPKITNLVLRGDIRWDGKNPESLTVPEWYPYLPKRA